MKKSAGILPFRRSDRGIEIYLGHMGGPFWRNKERSWSIIKGEIEEREDPLAAAKREFFEETGERIEGKFLPLGSIKTSNKMIYVWAVEAEPSTQIHSNTFEMEWPPKSGKRERFAEIDKAAWFDLAHAAEVIVKSQIPFLERIKALSA
ncbi:MAG: NUDIX hydrolase [Campylobacteraceae bacterium 4484_4]|nr:MAG: NUDIX hydrolase [Campylobacteraceae bacterium 4484_4]